MIVLDDGAARVEILPNLGAGLASYAWGGRPVLRPRDEQADEPVLGLAMNLLAPWSNRISGGGFAWGGTFHPLAPNLAGEPCPIHGNAWQSGWTPRRASATEALLTLASDGPGPFAYDAEVAYALTDGALTTRLTATSRAARALPFGLGLHPWLPRGPRTTLGARAARVQLQDHRHLPTGIAPIAERPGWDFADGRPLPPAWINNAFEGWDGRAVVGQPDLGMRIEMVAAGLPVLILYAPSPEAGFFCVESVSHLVDEHNAPEPRHLRPLGPGESMTVALTIAPGPGEDAW